MKKFYYVMLLYFFGISLLTAQTSTESFETEANGSTSFTDNGVIFNILSGAFQIHNVAGKGVNGTSDNTFIDNAGNPGTSFSIKTTSNLFKVNRFWMYLGLADQSLTTTGTLTITGKLSGVTKFTQVKTTGFTSSISSTNGYTLIDLTNLNGQNYSNLVIDELQITLNGGFQYGRLDAFTWVKDSNIVLNPCNLGVSISSKVDTVCNGSATGSATAVVTGGTAPYTYSWNTNPVQVSATAQNLNAGSYTLKVTDANSCSATAVVVINETVTAAPTMKTPQIFCNYARINDLEIPTGSSIIWYEAAIGGKPLLAHTVLTTGTYYAAELKGLCESAVRTPVNVVIKDVKAPYVNGTGSVYEIADVKGFNTDVVYDGLNYSSVSGLFDKSSGYLISETAQLNTITPLRYLPKNRLIASETTSGLIFRLQPYDGKNSLKISSSATDSLTVATGISNINTLYIAGASGDGNTSLDITVRFTDGSSQKFSGLFLKDWYNGAGYEIRGLGRIWGNNIENDNNNPRFYKLSLNLDPSHFMKSVSSISFYNPSTAVANIMAVSYRKVESVTVCDGSVLGNLAVVGSNVKWYSDETTASELPETTVFSDETLYYVSQTVGTCESLRHPFYVKTKPLPSAPSSSDQSYCIAEHKTVGDLVVTGATVNWYETATATTPLAVTDVLVTKTYYATQTLNGCESVNRKAVKITVYDTAAPSASDQSYCIAEHKTIGDLVVTGTAVKWYATSTATTPLAATDVLVTKTYYATQTLNGCESVNRTAVKITVYDTAAPSASDQSYCIAEHKTVGDLVVTGTGIKWYATLTATIPLVATDVLVTKTYYATQTLNGCESVNRTAIKITIHDTAVPSASDQSYCIAEHKTIGDLDVTGTAVKWYATSTATTPLAATDVLVTKTYYATQTLNGCESVNRTAVKITVYDTATPSASDQSYCIAEHKTVGDLVVTGAAVNWYATSTATTPLAATDVLVTKTYYATQTLNGCESVNRAAVKITVHDTAAPSSSDQSYCIAEHKTIGDLVVTGTAVKWYATSTATTPLAATDVLVTKTYYATQTLNGCESVNRTAVKITIHDTAAPSASDQSYCIAEHKTIGDLVVTGTAVKWYATSTATTPLAVTDVLVTKTYYATQTLNGCESVNRTAVKVTVYDTAAPSSSDQWYCIAEHKTVGDLVVTGAAVNWYATATATTPLAATDVLVTKTYYATQMLNGCESVNRTAVKVTVYDTPAPSVSDQIYCISENKKIGDILVKGTAVQWYDVAVGGAPLNSTVKLSTGIYYGSQTLNGCESVNRTAVKITIHDTAAPSAISVQTFCAGNSPTISDLMVMGTAVKWYSVATGGNELPLQTSLVNGNTYYATQTLNGCESVGRAVVKVILYQAPTIISSVLTVCSGTISGQVKIDTFNAGELKWYSTSTSVNELSSITVLTSGTYYVSTFTNGMCVSERRPLQVTVLNSVPVPVAVSQQFCGQATINDLTVQQIVNGAQVNWYSSYQSSVPLSGNTPLLSGTYYVEQKVGFCSSARLAVGIKIISVPAPTFTNFKLCEGATVGNPYLTSNGGSSYKWFLNSNSDTALADSYQLKSGYYFLANEQSGCISPKTKVYVDINSRPLPPTGSSVQTFSSQATVSDLKMNEPGVVWYNDHDDAMLGINSLWSTQKLTDGATYYGVILSSEGCPSVPTPVKVALVLNSSDLNLADLKYHPNPVLSELTISYPDPVLQTEVYDLTGRSVMKRNFEDTEVKLDFSTLGSGVYLVRIATENASQFIKIIKK